jgi:hypothetical protein
MYAIFGYCLQHRFGKQVSDEKRQYTYDASPISEPRDLTICRTNFMGCAEQSGGREELNSDVFI